MPVLLLVWPLSCAVAAKRCRRCGGGGVLAAAAAAVARLPTDAGPAGSSCSGRKVAVGLRVCAEAVCTACPHDLLITVRDARVGSAIGFFAASRTRVFISKSIT
jgi:hypothetical protein